MENNENDSLEILDFNDENTSSNNIEKDNSQVKKDVEINKNINQEKIDVKNDGNVASSNKKNTASIIIIIFILILLISIVFALPYIKEFLEPDKKSVNNQTIETIKTNKLNKKYVSNIDVKTELLKIRDIKSYMYQNVINIYVENKNSKKDIIKNDYKYLFNETKYKVEINKIDSNNSYEVIDYYEKLDDVYIIYTQDSENKNYAKSETTLDKFNFAYDIFPNVIDYLVENYEIDNEKQININNKNHINITLKTNIDVLNTTQKIENNIDISKSILDEIYVDLYFDETNDLYKIEFNIEDKNIYNNKDGEVKSVVSKYIFDEFNEVKNITLPNV